MNMPKDIFDEARLMIDEVKCKDYDSVDISFNRIARLWSVIFCRTISVQDVALCMIALKISRQMAKPSRENLVDILGYTYCLHKLNEGDYTNDYKRST